MKIVPLKDKTVEYITERGPQDVTFILKVFDPITAVKFKELGEKAATAKERDMFKIHNDLVQIGVKHALNSEGEKIPDKEMKLEWFIIEELSNKITAINQFRQENVKK